MAKRAKSQVGNAPKKRRPKKATLRSVANSPTLMATGIPTGIASPNNAVVVEDAAGEAHGLGHVHTHDDGDFGYPMSPHVGEIDGDPLSQTQVYALGPILNQHKTQSCVGHGWTLFLTSAPRLTKAGPDPYQIYHEAQQLDDTPGEEPVYYGTSVRAGAKAMLQEGWINGDYVWAEDVRVLWKFILTRGPVVLGSDWYTGMNQADNNGFVNVSGDRVGGHCYLCYGVSADDRALLCANSWGQDWGRDGTFLLRYDDARQLFFQHALVACSALENT
jgi:hypothetical protein